MAHIVSPVETWAQRQGERIVVQHNEHVSSAHQLHQQVACSSWCLSTVHGVQPGDRVALLGLNTASFFVTFLAIADSGAIVCPINWRWTPQELAQALGAISPRLLLYDPDFQQLAQQALALVAGQRPPAAVSMEQLVQTSAHPPMAASSSTVAVDGAQQLQLRRPTDGAALIVFTSGTTGASKAAVLSHDALMHQSMAKLVTVGYTAGDTYLHLAPLFHIGGISSSLAVLLAGGAHVFLPRYSAAAAARLIQQHQVTALIAVPTMITDLVQHQQQHQQQALEPPSVARVSGPQHPSLGASSSSSSRAGLKGTANNRNHVQSAAAAAATGSRLVPLPSVQRLLVGAGGMTPSVQAQLFQLFPHATVWTAYGMTEGASSLTFQQLLPSSAAPSGGSASAGDHPGSIRNHGRTVMDDTVSKASSSVGGGAGSFGAAGVCVGAPAPGVTIRIQQQPVDPSPGTPTTATPATTTTSSSSSSSTGVMEAPADPVVGEVVTRGPHVMLGYWGDTSATARVLSPDGWFHTGDLGWLDAQGRLWLAGRSKDMVKTGGENVLAAEVERVLLTHPGVTAAAVVGVPHARLGEQVAAAVVLHPGWHWEAEQAGAAAAPGMQLWAPPPSPLQQQQQHVLSVGHLQQACRAAGLAGYKVPRLVVPVQQLPLNSSGKVVKALVKQLLLPDSDVVHSRL